MISPAIFSEFVKGVIRSGHRMTYTEVARILEAAPAGAMPSDKDDERRYGPYLGDFRLMGEVAALPEVDLEYDDQGKVSGAHFAKHDLSHQLIEEFMLAANEAVAKKLLFAKQPGIYRVHDRPDPDRLVDLKEVLEGFGYELKGDLAEVPPSAFQRLLKQIEG